ncbi:Predicted lipoprotein [Mameliella alba]|uniref:DUF2291 family protein n=1 Tax=Mameliella alba TaxID=561184 RepID=UPI000884AC77|nr:DUF2291 domain-containing protein [Mameliella alba]OWV50482.1 DUF2291 domain-containing protein [Mameliella alba]PTR42093.1 putative lipoprotein [Mameliella alba]GGF54954.1 lipoprotein [Mameliella alba]SDB98555.1 Predicted lipoprotein [Mameliella alba]
MRQAILSGALVCLLLPAAACKIVPNPDPNDQSEALASRTDEARMAAYVDANWESQVLPVIAEHEVAYDTWRQALAQGLDAAGEAHGLRPDGEANPWNFVVSGTGTVTEAKLDSRAAKMQVDMDSDGAADVVLQLGPIIRGTAMRDAMPFVVFTDFRDQIEFAKLARAMNERASAGLTRPEGDVIGQTVSFTGVFTLRAAGDTPEIVPVEIEMGATP